jgi:hypothetical protein
MSAWTDLKGTTENFFRVGGIAGLKAIAGGLQLRNFGDTADNKIVASRAELSGDDLLINSDAAGTGSDWTFTLARNPVQTANLTIQAPPAKGTDGFFLRQKPGTAGGVLELELASVAAAGGSLIQDTTTIAFGAGVTNAMFSTPSGAIIEKVKVIIDTPFNGTPTLTVGIAGTTAKYMGAAQNNLNGVAADSYESTPNLPSTAGESLIATYAAGGATVGSARIIVSYSVPT